MTAVLGSGGGVEDLNRDTLQMNSRLQQQLARIVGAEGSTGSVAVDVHRGPGEAILEAMEDAVRPWRRQISTDSAV